VTKRTHKIGAVSYLNTVPLIHELGILAPEYEVVLDLPSRLADRLAAGEMDVALIPSIEVPLASDLTIVSDACIGCCGPVWSVKLLSRVPIEKIRSVALDEGSRTSVVLTKLLLQKQYGTVPKYCTLSMNDDYRMVSTDAVLVIGDRAMQSTQIGFPHQYDLGQCWQEWTGLPFVFAVWAARPWADLDRLAAVLGEARDQGVAMAASIAKSQSAKYDLSVGQCLRYFTEFLNFRFGEAEKTSLQVFFQRASELSFIPANTELRFHDCEVA
jgi:chorismate dehydratase